MKCSLLHWVPGDSCDQSGRLIGPSYSLLLFLAVPIGHYNPCSHRPMDAQVRAILSSPTFYPQQHHQPSEAIANDSPPEALADEISQFTVALKAAGKLTTNSSSRAVHFAIHLAHLKFNHGELVKKSSLTAAIYNRELAVCLRHCTRPDSPVITPKSVASFYSVSGFEAFLKEIKCSQTVAVEFLASLVAAAGAAKCSAQRMGTVAEVAAVWGQDSEALRVTVTAVKKSLPGADACRALFTTTASSTASSSTAPSGNRTSKRQSPTKAGQSTEHPLLLLSCSSIGPAFGPIIVK